MNFLEIKEPEKIMAKALLIDIYNWKDKKKEYLMDKYPNLPKEDLENKIQNAFARKFRNQFNTIINIKLLRILNKKN